MENCLILMQNFILNFNELEEEKQIRKIFKLFRLNLNHLEKE